MLKKELRQTKTEVLDILERFEGTRNNDFYLVWLWLKYYGGLDELPFLEWKKIEKLSGKFESIRRVRQKIQNEDQMFLPTDPQVFVRRHKRERRFRESINEV
jgi:hypothetical protein